MFQLKAGYTVYVFFWIHWRILHVQTADVFWIAKYCTGSAVSFFVHRSWRRSVHFALLFSVDTSSFMFHDTFAFMWKELLAINAPCVVELIWKQTQEFQVLYLWHFTCVDRVLSKVVLYYGNRRRWTHETWSFSDLFLCVRYVNKTTPRRMVEFVERL